MKLLPIPPLKPEHLVAALLLSGSLLNTHAISSNIASTPIYKWQDDQGRTHYSDVAPPNKSTEQLALTPLNLQQSLTKDIKTDNSETKTTDDTKQTGKKQEQEDAKKTKARGSLVGVQDSKEVKQPTVYDYPEYPGYYYPPYQYPHRSPHRNPHRNPHHSPHRPTPCLYQGQGCDNLGKPDYAHKKHQRYNKKNRPNTAVSYPGFERPNLYWDPYPYSKATPRR
jgi:Domain of unknown function (DUF4124)